MVVASAELDSRIADEMDLSEAGTRTLLIDPALKEAEWPLYDRSLVKFEVPADGYDAEPWNGVTDYCLYDSSGNVLAVLEARDGIDSPC